MIFRRLRRILAAENADYTSIAYFPALFKSEFRRKSESDHRYTKKAAQSENCTAFLKNLWCGRQDLNFIPQMFQLAVTFILSRICVIFSF